MGSKENAQMGNRPDAMARERLISLVEQILERSAADPFPVDQRLSDLGMSSIKMVNLMLAVETEFDIMIPQAEITPENFFSISSIEALVTRLTTAVATA
jgi:acyl carrier protein